MKNIFKKAVKNVPEAIDEKTLAEFNVELNALLTKYSFVLAVEKVPETHQFVVKRK